MLVITNQQLGSLAAEAGRQSEVRIVAHVCRVFPHEARQLGDQALRELARIGARECADAGITRERDVALYVDLMVGLGSTFRSDPANEWTAEILETASLDGTEKIDAIYRVLQTRPEAAAQTEVSP